MACEFASAMPCFAIGPTTAAAMRRLGMEVAAEAADRTFEGLAKLVAEQFARNE
ncbi:MAG: hypothetical protein BWZ10_03108 [candidate division BRC1 bacterium ADurb.BinA364]|nr:MAG: hypothetical protein BWZ10_03108 [candidate division BRC1 bacterium ADurb.BinA364]